MDAAFALEVLKRAPYNTVSMLSAEGTPYAVPLSLVWTDEHTAYFHCAMEGYKLDCLKNDQRVYISAVSKCRPTMSEDGKSFTLEYQSAGAEGTAAIVDDEKEKIEALRALCERFLPSHMDQFDAAVEHSLARTMIVRITLTAPPIGKRKQIHSHCEAPSHSAHN